MKEEAEPRPLEEQIIDRFERSSRGKEYIRNPKRLHLALYLDQQFSYINKKGNFMTISDEELKKLRDAKRLYPTFKNKIKPAALTISAQFTQRQAKMSLVPKTSATSVKMSSNAGNDVLRHYTGKGDYQIENSECSQWTVVTGDAYQWTHPVAATDEKVKITDPETGQVTSVPAEVDITTETLSWEQFYPPEGLRKIPEMPWIVIARLRDRKEVENQYAARLKKLGKELSEGSEANRTEFDLDSGTLMGIKRGDQKLIIEYFEKPTPEKPRGRHCVMVKEDRIMLEEGEFPYWDKNPKTGKEKWGGYRIEHFQFVRTLVAHWGQSMVADVTDLQKALNHLLTIYRTNLVLTMGVKCAIEQGTKIDPDFMTNEPSPVTYPKDGKPPAYMEPPRLSTSAQDFINYLEHSIDEVIGIHPLSTGNEPERRMPAVAVQMIVQIDMNKFHPIIANYILGMRNVAWNILKGVRQFCPQKVKEILTPERQLEWEAFMADDLDDYELDVDIESGMPETKAGRISTILEIMKNTNGQIIDFNNPIDKATFWNAVGEGYVADFPRRVNEAVDYAAEENRMILSGQEPVFSEYHQNGLHIEVHKRIPNSIDFRKLLEDPVKMAIYQKHMSLHLGKEAQDDMAMAAMAEQAQQQQLKQQLGMQGALQPEMPPGAEEQAPQGGPNAQ